MLPSMIIEGNMNMLIKERYEIRANIFKAMAHPTRLFIVEELVNSEKCVNEFQKMIKCDMSTVSKHLALLKNAGIIESQKRGNHIYYKLKFPCIMNFFECVESVIKRQISDSVKSI
jgi:DNA-binding transcriptional ArsR family regulator